MALSQRQIIAPLRPHSNRPEHLLVGQLPIRRLSGGMLQSRRSMFCPQCQAEYLPHVRRCSDCDVPLVEHLPVTVGDFERQQRSRFIVFKELGLLIVLPILFLSIMLDFVALRDNQFGIQIASIIGYTGFVFLLVFCDTRGWKGYSLGEKAIRQKLPMLLCIHAGFLVVVFAGVTGAILIRPHLSLFWTLERGTQRPLSWRGRGPISYFELVSIFTGVGIVFTQTLICRGILGRAMNEQRSARS